MGLYVIIVFVPDLSTLIQDDTHVSSINVQLHGETNESRIVEAP